jgi:hypothetical protein
MSLEKRIEKLEWAVEEYDFVATLRNMPDEKLAELIVEGSISNTVCGYDRKETRRQSLREAEWLYREMVRNSVGVDRETIDTRITEQEQDWNDQSNLETTPEAGITLTNGEGI